MRHVLPVTLAIAVAGSLVAQTPPLDVGIINARLHGFGAAPFEVDGAR